MNQQRINFTTNPSIRLNYDTPSIYGDCDPAQCKFPAILEQAGKLPSLEQAENFLNTQPGVLSDGIKNFDGTRILSVYCRIAGVQCGDTTFAESNP